jgi:hypothetical protein
VLVKDVLDKITDHNSDVLGCIVKAKGETFHNLPEMYDMVDANAVGEYAENTFSLTDELGTGKADLEQLFLEFTHHSFYARKIEDGVLLLLNKPIQRRAFKKMQVGVNLYMKPLKRAIDEKDAAASAAATEAPPQEAAPEEAAEAKQEPRRRGRRFYRGVEY